MLSRKSIAFVLIALFIASQGCYTLNQTGVSEMPIEITNSEGSTSVTHFNKSKKVNHFLWGLVSPDDAEVEKMVTDQVKANDAARAVNVHMKYRLTFVDGLISAITLGIYTPFTLEVEGDVVK